MRSSRLPVTQPGRLDAERRRLEEEKRKIEEEKRRLEEEKRRLEEVNRFFRLIWTAVVHCERLKF